MYTTCVIWLAFVPLYFGTANHVPLRITSMSVTISLSASVTVACLFSPKVIILDHPSGFEIIGITIIHSQLYIILIRPERNVRQSMMPVRYSAINKNQNSGSTSMMSTVMLTATTCNQKEKIQRHMSIVEAAGPVQLPGKSNSRNLKIQLDINGNFFYLICSKK
jgi:metabotropic X receptor